MMGSAGASTAWLHLRSGAETLLLLILAVIGVGIFSLALPHPLGSPMVPQMHVANFLPAIGAAAVGAALRPRWEPHYAQASAGASTVGGRLIFSGAILAMICGLGVALWIGGAAPTLIFLVVTHTVAGSGLACAVHALSPRTAYAPLAVGCVVALVLGISAWVPETIPVLGDALGAGMRPEAVITEYAIGLVGTVMLVLAGRPHR